MQADPRPRTIAQNAGEPLGQTPGSAQRAFGMIGLRLWCPPERHQSVARVLVDHPALRLDQRAGGLEEAREVVRDLGGGAPTGKAGEALKVEKHDGHVPLLRRGGALGQVQQSAGQNPRHVGGKLLQRRRRSRRALADRAPFTQPRPLHVGLPCPLEVERGQRPQHVVKPADPSRQMPTQHPGPHGGQRRQEQADARSDGGGVARVGGVGGGHRDHQRQRRRPIAGHAPGEVDMHIARNFAQVPTRRSKPFGHVVLRQTRIPDRGDDRVRAVADQRQGGAFVRPFQRDAAGIGDQPVSARHDESRDPVARGHVLGIARNARPGDAHAEQAQKRPVPQHRRPMVQDHVPERERVEGRRPDGDAPCPGIRHGLGCERQVIQGFFDLQQRVPLPPEHRAVETDPADPEDLRRPRKQAMHEGSEHRLVRGIDHSFGDQALRLIHLGLDRIEQALDLGLQPVHHRLGPLQDQLFGHTRRHGIAHQDRRCGPAHDQRGKHKRQKGREADRGLGLRHVSLAGRARGPGRS
ncbi:hypothetical protein jaqu_19610 [Jannaschia aquimarina]|uniref:Uncharacterized protein n=1 Tax=Jannaschia aquimarina TaxID=935700 RepID=A0A0D1EK89_9RHOB|nr:hypothetical protein jaqu_19610 [Jannaschia aquimarina]